MSKLKERFIDFGHRFTGASEKIYTLVMMQLKDKWNFSFKTDKKGTLLKLSVYIILFAVITAIAYILMYLSAARFSIFVGSKIPLTAMGPLIAIITLFEGISIFVGMTRSLFFAKDNAVLITYPVKSDYLFISKVIVYYIDAIKRSFTLLLPIIIAFGIIYKFPFYYYLWILFLDILYVGFIVLICGLLSIPGFYILRFLDKNRFVKIIVALLFLAILIVGVVFIYNLIPSNINLIREYERFAKGLNEALYWFSTNFRFFTAVARMFCGTRNGISSKPFSIYSWAGLLVMIAVITGLIFANKYLAKPFYTKMIASSGIKNHESNKAKRNKTRSEFKSILHYEFARIVRDEKLMVATIVCVTVMPLFTLLANKVYGSFNTSPRGDTLIYLFNFIFIFLVVASHNISASYIFSKDGPSWTVNKTMPTNPQLSLTLRLVYNIFVSLLIIIPSSIIFFYHHYWSDGGISSYNATHFGSLRGFLNSPSITFFILTIFIFGVLHCFLSASYDYSNSKNKDKADIGSEIVSTHELVSLGLAFLIMVVAALFIVIFMLTSTNATQLRLFIIASLITALGIYSFLRKVKLTYQEN